MLLRLRKERRMLLRRVVSTLGIPWLRRRIAAREDRICLRFGEVMCVVDGSEWRWLEWPRHVLRRRRKC